ncbi:DRMBL-domain-containing protein [Ceratobasidium sp. AG-I]|nr:DRMBL-domain-containing protein [Ceratobasidium sp. AG-I]
MSSREEKAAWDAVDAAQQAKREANFVKPDTKGKSKAKGKANAAESGRQRRPAPFYKVMPGMPIAVDAFCYGKIPGVTAYFLSHAHSDHYTSLSSSWKHGLIYCSVTTANLIKHMLRVDPKWVRPLPENEAVEIPDTGGVKVTLIDANHCPGSSLFVFTGKQTIDAGDSPIKSSFIGSNRQFTYLHCGDFRACPGHALHPAICGQRLDTVYLDTTYLNPKYCFPPQTMVIDACAELAKQYVSGDKNTSLPALPSNQPTVGGWFKPSQKMAARFGPPSPSPQTATGKAGPGVGTKQTVLVVVGTYTIGKERVLKAIAKALSSKIYCDSRKHAVFMCQADPVLHAMLTKNPAEAQVHVLPLGQINIERLKEYLELHRARHDRILGFRPTGWTYAPPAGQSTTPTIEQILAQTKNHNYAAADLRSQRGSNARVTIYGVPYSEHSSFRELTCFALSVDWVRMIATVNVGNAESRRKMQVWFEKWAKARKDRGGIMVEHRCDDYW